MTAPAVTVTHLVKRYGGVVALADANVTVGAGSIHAVAGENGAGKSTLMKILAGATQQDSGSFALAGHPAAFRSPQEAQAAGVQIVYQELSLFPDRSVLANLYPTKQPSRFGIVSRGRMLNSARALFAQVGLDCDPLAPVRRLTVGQRQQVELCRALLASPQVLILDEPNSALTAAETARLFKILADLRQAGLAIIYVSHRLEEVFSIADTITVIRDGRDVLTSERSGLEMRDVVTAMIGTRPETRPARPSRAIAAGAPRLEVRDLTVGRELSEVSFDAEAGEIVGLAGLEGSGIQGLLDALFGLRPVTGGYATFPSGGGLPHGPIAATRRGISLVPADRRRQGLMLRRSVAFNLAHVSVGSLNRTGWWLRRSSLNRIAMRQMQSLRVKSQSPWVPVDQLSGGNQQKVVIGKWLEVAPAVVLLDDPTRGVDVGAKHEIYNIIRELAAAGRVVLMSSTELPELIAVADRILVFYRGRVVAELHGSVDERTLLHAVNTGVVGADNDNQITMTDRG